VLGDGTRRHVVLRSVDANVLAHAEPKRHVHRGFDRRAAYLAVTLGCVRVAEREEGPLDPDREVERGAGIEVLRVHVAAPARGRDDRMRPRLRRRHPERAREGAERQRDAVGEAHAIVGDLRDPQPWVRELVGQQSEARDDRRPAPVRRLELEQLDGKRVSWFGSLDVDRAADRVDLREIERRDVGGGRVADDLLVRGVADVEDDHLAGLDLQRGLERVVPRVCESVRAKLVDRSRLHRRRSSRSRSGLRKVAANSAPGGRIVRPTTAEHRRDDLHLR
jgi:hypothetical protein